MPLIFIFLVLLSVAALAQDAPYAGEEARAVKSLSNAEMDNYLMGQGMGFAKAAELNHYPGPKHVMDMAQALALSKTQIAQTQEIYRQMHAQAVRLGEQIIGKEKELNDLFANRRIDAEQLKQTTSALGKLQGELRFVHLQAHLQMKQLLTSDQIEKYDAQRGYKINPGASSHKNHH